MELEIKLQSKTNVKMKQLRKTFCPLKEDELGDSYLTVFTKIFLIFVGEHNFTYIIGHYTPSVRIIDRVSHRSTPNDRFFEKLFMAILFTSQSFCQKCAERKSPKKYFFSYFVLMPGLGLEPWLFV